MKMSGNPDVIACTARAIRHGWYARARVRGGCRPTKQSHLDEFHLKSGDCFALVGLAMTFENKMSESYG
jgi:hypothetical protein